MKKEIVTKSELFSITNGNNEEFKVLETLNSLYLANEEADPERFMELKKQVKEAAPAICALHRRLEIIKGAMELAKAEIEYAANLVPMDNEFKWQQPRRSTTCTDMYGLYVISQSEGTSSEYFMSKAKPMSSKDAAEILGLSEVALLEKHGDIFETKESKPVLKRLY